MINNSLIRYLFVGALTYAIYYSSLFLCYTIIGFSMNSSVTFSYVASVIYHFYGWKNFTYRVQDKPTKIQIFRYVIWIILSYMIQIFIVNLMSYFTKINFYYIVIIATIPVTFIGYYLSKRWIFK
jgi:putative flippase GtrA